MPAGSDSPVTTECLHCQTSRGAGGWQQYSAVHEPSRLTWHWLFLVISVSVCMCAQQCNVRPCQHVWVCTAQQPTSLTTTQWRAILRAGLGFWLVASEDKPAQFLTDPSSYVLVKLIFWSENKLVSHSSNGNDSHQNEKGSCDESVLKSHFFHVYLCTGMFMYSQIVTPFRPSVWPLRATTKKKKKGDPKVNMWPAARELTEVRGNSGRQDKRRMEGWMLA